MKKLLAVISIGVLVAGAYLLGTFNASKVIEIPAAEWTDDSEAAEAWRNFVASMEVAGAQVFASTEDPRERLDGLVYLSQLAAASLEMKLAKGDEKYPRFTNWMADYRKFLGDSPDAIYHTAELSSDFDYEISGNRADAKYLGFMLYGKGLNGWNRAAANISSKSLRFDDSGNFTILLSKSKPDGGDVDWLQLDEDIHMVMVRQYYHGRSGKQKAHFTIRNLSQPLFTRRTDSEVAGGLINAATFFAETLDGAIALEDMLSRGANSIDPPKSYNADFGGIFYPTHDNEYYGTWFSLGEDEALVIEGEVPDAPYWALTLQNRWMQSLDYEHYSVALNDTEIDTQAGRYKVIVSHRKPDSDNWLNTTGLREGLLAIRYQNSKDSKKPTLKVVKFDQL